MAKWKLCRQTFGSETFTFSEGDEVSLGRGLNNTISLSSLVISRSHCLINFRRDKILITDLNVSSSIYLPYTNIYKMYKLIIIIISQHRFAKGLRFLSLQLSNQGLSHEESPKYEGFDCQEIWGSSSKPSDKHGLADAWL